MEKHGSTKSEDTRERILVAAIQRFSKFGYRRTSINDVAEEAGLARATVYLYWRKKEDLFISGLERFNSLSWKLAETAAAKKGSAAERIRATVVAQYGATSDIVHGTASGHELFEANLELGGAVVQQCLRHGEKLLTGLLQQGIRDGEFDLQRSAARSGDVAHIIVSFAQNSLLDRHHTQNTGFHSRLHWGLRNARGSKACDSFFLLSPELIVAQHRGREGQGPTKTPAAAFRARAAFGTEVWAGGMTYMSARSAD
jgi:AcrR family transcriptional regulator